MYSGTHKQNINLLINSNYGKHFYFISRAEIAGTDSGREIWQRKEGARQNMKDEILNVETGDRLNDGMDDHWKNGTADQ